MMDILKAFLGAKALPDVNLTVERGEVHALGGQNSAGKSTQMKVLSGVCPHGTYEVYPHGTHEVYTHGTHEGETVLDGQPASCSGISDSEPSGVVTIRQELALSLFLLVADNTFPGNEQAKCGVIDCNATNLEAAQLLARVSSEESPVTKITDLGVGKQQLVEIAKAPSKEVKVLILDEPTAALNDTDSAHLLELITDSHI